MNDKENKFVHLKDGSEWAEHENFIVGDESGLRNLIKACEEALERGISLKNDLGDYIGVKKLEESWFKDPKDRGSFDFPSFIFSAVLVLLVILIIIGGYTAISWIT